MKTEEYGCYWCIVGKSINDKIYINADRLEVHDGCLLFSDDAGKITFTVANGLWKTCYLTSVPRGSWFPVA